MTKVFGAAVPVVAPLSTAAGSFGLAGKYTCPSASSLICLTATGGNAGSGNNAGIGLNKACHIATFRLRQSEYLNSNTVPRREQVRARVEFVRID